MNDIAEITALTEVAMEAVAEEPKPADPPVPNCSRSGVHVGPSGAAGSNEDKPMVHKVEDMLKDAFGGGEAWCNTRARFLAIDIVKMAMHDWGVETPMDLAPKKKQKDEGGGARGRQSKDETVTEALEKLDEMLETLGRDPDGVVQNIVQAINLIKVMQPGDVWNRLQMKELESINGITTINGNAGLKTERIAKIVLAQCFTALGKRAKMHKLAEEAMAHSIMCLLLQKFGNEAGQIQWMSSDPGQAHTVSYSVLNAIKGKAAAVGAQHAAVAAGGGAFGAGAGPAFAAAAGGGDMDLLG